MEYAVNIDMDKVTEWVALIGIAASLVAIAYGLAYL